PSRRKRRGCRRRSAADRGAARPRRMLPPTTSPPPVRSRGRRYRRPPSQEFPGCFLASYLDGHFAITPSGETSSPLVVLSLPLQTTSESSLKVSGTAPK